jgi:tRNA U55 pseudouridine synthase TruB
MRNHTLSPLSPEMWMLDMFSSKAARSGTVIRRKIRDIERHVGRAEFEEELKRRGYHAVENAGQMVIFCNQQPIRVVV